MKYTPEQLFYFKRALYGLKAYEQEEIEQMLFQKKRRIIKVYKRSQDILNEYKQEKINEKTNVIFSIFKNSKLCQDIISYNETDKEFLNTLSFKDLGIKKEDLIKLLYQKGILPQNFYEI